MIELLQTLFEPLTRLLGATLSTFHGWGAPWWLSIAFLTIVVRTSLFPLTIKQVKSMRAMQELKPDMDRIRAEYKEDPQRQQQEIMQLYGERKVNPLGGCLPVLVQMPIFITLYYTIKGFENNVQSFHAGGLLWFKDLVQPDPYFILPVISILTMMASQEIVIRKTDPQQKTLMRVMPAAFGVFLSAFPAGLFMYYITSNLVTLAQNLLIYNTRLGAPRVPDVPPTAPAGETAEEKAPEERATSPAAKKPRPAARNGGGSGSGRSTRRKKSGKRKSNKKR